ncbi:zinc-ribbon domain and TM2 domain-containing protein [Halosimplex pelagicum]|uniref:NINE protein n=1 Tax=Halosimplex pelagicum TaxID=869886 RepID=A0A7D5P444_9EURY|nr:NINE protein [Halosimplex pelagicum]QLH80443.1 NINE protein [Halosimplex pelagicum]
MSNDERDDRDEPDDADPGDTESGEGGGQPPVDDGGGGDRPDDGGDDSWVSDSVDERDESTPTGGGPSDSGSAGAGGVDHGTGDHSTGSSGSGRKGPGEKFCSECGAVINEKAEICPECGVRQPGMGSDNDERVIAALLAILLGTIGAHKFYMGKTGQGVLYLCFFWTGIPTIIGLVEGIIYLTKSDEEFRRQYMDD